MAEQFAVNEKVPGSNPGRGASSSRTSNVCYKRSLQPSVIICE